MERLQINQRFINQLEQLNNEKNMIIDAIIYSYQLVNIEQSINRSQGCYAKQSANSGPCVLRHPDKSPPHAPKTSQRRHSSSKV